ncbi:penicillin-binding protein activator [Conservatibacter flavescens]|uniref:Penicillin-binding protein activator LpoA n=1 Tax=Conservatibacter flavescens TaxID=28161 RepID=A0A2M8S5Y2_9PAST|nr:penicillin-binding protein activator [Conservatibacter flavescens]PJG86556.1 penicillin-binding protein activator [Conservatibacter flavescens]
MSTILLQRINFKNLLMPFFCALFLAGCTTGGLFSFGSGLTDLLKNDAHASSDFYLGRVAQQQNPEDKITYQLLAARVLVTENKISQAEAVLAELGKVENKEQLLDKALIEADIAAVKRQNDKAESQLKAINLSQLSPSQTARYYQTEARIAENRYDVVGAVRARGKMDAVLTDTQKKQENNDRTWALLRHANKGIINNTDAQGDVTLAGWLALAKAYNDNVAQPARLNEALQNWRAAYPSHTAAYLFPTELQSIFNFQQTQLNQIGLLLPLSGNAQLIGNTIKSGFDDARGENAMPVQVFDTVATPVATIVEQAKQAGITALVGPLIKSNVDTMLSSDIQGLDILALNSTPNSRALTQVCYYGLSPEDEAESAANKMWNDGVREPLVIVPQSDLGQRTASAFNIRWQQLAATDANIRFYTNADDIVFALQENLNQNVQALYIVALSENLPSIKTAIDNSNRNLKLYASSRSNSSNNGPEYRLLMNGLQFSDIPFFKDTSSEQYKKVEALTNGDYSLMRLYAMGSDAWLLINQFNELRQVPGYSITGLTGTLSAGPNCNVERDMTWMQYENGEIKILN